MLKWTNKKDSRFGMRTLVTKDAIIVSHENKRQFNGTKLFLYFLVFSNSIDNTIPKVVTIFGLPQKYDW